MKTILYVEDNYENRVLVRRVLEADGYAMIEAGTAQDSVNLILACQT